MIRHFIAKEFFENIYGPKFLITFAICTVLILTSIYTGYDIYQTEQRWYATATSENLKAMINYGSYDILKARGTKAFREPPRMSIFVKGVDSSIGKAAIVTEWPNIVLRDSRFELNPIFAVFGELDMAFIVQIILSLFAVLFSYNAVSGERELGTLKLVMSSSVSRASFLIGKTIGGLLSFLLPFIIPFMLGLLMLQFVFNVNFSLEEWWRIGLMGLVFSLYLAVFYMIGLLMSALTRNSLMSFLLALFCWVLSIVIIPKGAVELARQIYPAPSIDRMEAEIASINREYYSNIKSAGEKHFRENFDGNDENFGPVFENALEYGKKEAQQKRFEKEEPLLRSYERDQMRLLMTAESISRISPTSCVTLAACRLAHTDVELRGRFMKSLRTFRSQFVKYVEEVAKTHPGGPSSVFGTLSSGNIKIYVPDTEIELPGFPGFTLPQEPLASTVNSVSLDIAVLSFDFILLFSGAYLAFRKYDVR